MKIAVLQPIKIDPKEGSKTLDHGTILTLPDDHAQTLLGVDPLKVARFPKSRFVSACGFPIAILRTFKVRPIITTLLKGRP